MDALGKSYAEVDKQQSSFDFLPGYKPHGPVSSAIAEEEITASGLREKHRQKILKAMHTLKATKERPVTGAQIAREAEMSVVQVMRRLKVDIADKGMCGCTGVKMKCRLTGKSLLGWYLRK